MAQSSILGRVSQLVRANVNALIDGAEDPQKMLDQLVRDFTDNIREAEEAVAQTIGNLRLQEEDSQEASEAAADWGSKAAAASKKADELRAAGNADADKFDNLAKIALGKQVSAENEAKDAEPTIASQTTTVEQLKTGLDGMHAKLSELISKRDELVARSKTVDAQSQVLDAVKSIDVMDPTSELGRFEDKVRREEAKVAGQQELAASSLDSQFENLDDLGKQAEVDARLAALKAGGTPQAITQ
jgi:phage shock protein A